jgi:hypothetical protein
MWQLTRNLVKTEGRAPETTATVLQWGCGKDLILVVPAGMVLPMQPAMLG